MRRDLKWKLKEHNHQAHVIPVKTRKKLDPRIDYDDDFDSGPQRMSISGRKQVGYNAKETGGYGGVSSYHVLGRILLKQVGKSFDVVYSRLCSQIPAHTEMRRDLDRVVEQPEISRWSYRPEFHKDENGVFVGTPWWVSNDWRLTKEEKRRYRGDVTTIRIDELHLYQKQTEYYNPSTKLWEKYPGRWESITHQNQREVWCHVTYKKVPHGIPRPRLDGLHQALLDSVKNEPRVDLVKIKTRNTDHKEMNWIKSCLQGGNLMR